MFPGAAVIPLGWAERAGALEGAGLLVQSTALGMKGQPPLDLPLDALGDEQARLAAGTLAGLRLEAVYASPLARAMGTARWVAGPHGLDPVAVPELTEADVGRWEGLTWEQARESDPELYERFHADPGTVPYPDGESFLDVGRRVSPAIATSACCTRSRTASTLSR